MSQHVYIGIVTYNSSEHILQCLGMLSKQLYRLHKIIIFDNKSTDNTTYLIKSNYPHIPIIYSSTNIGFGMGHNEIIRQSHAKKTDFYLMLNPDAYLKPSYISELVTLLNRRDAAWGTGKLLLHGSKKLYSVGHGIQKDGYAFNIGYGLEDVGQYEKEREIFGAPAAASLWRFEALEKLKNGDDVFDRDMFMYAEDTDLDWRARILGFTCWYSPKSIAYHQGSNASGRLALHAVRNRYISVMKNADFISLVFYNFPILFLHTILRIFMTPYDGIWLGVNLIKAIPIALKKRSSLLLIDRNMVQWFSWSSFECTNQPLSIRTRLISFKKRNSYE